MKDLNHQPRASLQVLLAEWFDQNRLLDLFAGAALRALGAGGQAPHLPTARGPLKYEP